ncbi:MAG: hypothetical protein R2695_11950 [Acidimicrobiales bacterium]
MAERCQRGGRGRVPQGSIRWVDIPDVLDAVMQRWPGTAAADVDVVLDADHEAPGGDRDDPTEGVRMTETIEPRQPWVGPIGLTAAIVALGMFAG